MYDDRIEIISYGGLPFSLSKEGFFRGTSVPVNKSLLTNIKRNVKNPGLVPTRY